jgi:hypothetical protein
MNMFWNGTWFVSSEWGSDAFVSVVRAAAIAAMVSSCTSMTNQFETDIVDAAVSEANAQEPSDAPLVMELDPDLSDRIIQQAADILGIAPGQLENVYATISYKVDGGEKLLSLVSDPDLVGASKEQRLIDATAFRIPTPKEDLTTEEDVTSEFAEVIIVSTKSPAAQASCGAGAGSRFCRP